MVDSVGGIQSALALIGHQVQKQTEQAEAQVVSAALDASKAIVSEGAEAAAAPPPAADGRGTAVDTVA